LDRSGSIRELPSRSNSRVTVFFSRGIKISHCVKVSSRHNESLSKRKDVIGALERVNKLDTNALLCMFRNMARRDSIRTPSVSREGKVTYFRNSMAPMIEYPLEAATQNVRRLGCRICRGLCCNGSSEIAAQSDCRLRATDRT